MASNSPTPMNRWDDGRRKETGVSLLEVLILLALLGILAAFASLSVGWFPLAQKKEAARQSAQFLYALFEEARKLERSYGRDVYLAWETDKSGSITQVSLYLDDNLDSVFNQDKDTLLDSWDFSAMFKGSRIIPDMNATAEEYLSIQTGPRVSFASGAGTFWVLTEDSFKEAPSGNPKRYASYGVVVSNTNNMGARICQAGLDCP